MEEKREREEERRTRKKRKRRTRKKGRMREEIKDIKIRKEEIKLPRFANGMIAYTESKNLLELMNDLGKVTEYKINI